MFCNIWIFILCTDLRNNAKPKQTSSVYRVKSEIRKLISDDNEDSYGKMHHFLQLFVDANRGAVTCLQKDKEGRFWRCFVASPVAASACAEDGSTKKVLGADGTHFCNPLYNGIMLLLHTIDGNGRTMLVAFAIVPVESEEHWYWFFRLCKESGVNFGDKILFVDRDKGSIAASLQMGFAGNQMHLRWCTEHIKRNCRSKFGISSSDKEFEALFYGLQASKSVQEHRAMMKKMCQHYGAGLGEYLQAINPTSWMLYANFSGYKDEMKKWSDFLQNEKKDEGEEGKGEEPSPVTSVDVDTIENCFVGRPMRLYGIKNSNFVEGQNGLLKREGMCAELPYCALRDGVNKMVKQSFERSELAKKWVEEGRELTPYAKERFDHEKDCAGRCDHIQVSISDNLENIVVWDAYKDNLHFEVNVKTIRCTCMTFDQHGIVCRHLIYAMRLCKRESDVMTAFDKAYKLESYVAAFRYKFIAPVIPQQVLNMRGMGVPPLYTQVGRPAKCRGGHNAKLHIKSAGEGSGGKCRHSTCSICGESGHNTVTCSNFSKTKMVSITSSVAGDIVFGNIIECIHHPRHCHYPSCSASIHVHYMCSKHWSNIRNNMLNAVSSADVEKWGKAFVNSNNKLKRPNGEKTTLKNKKRCVEDEDPDFEATDEPLQSQTSVAYNEVFGYCDSPIHSITVSGNNEHNFPFKDEEFKDMYDAIFNHVNTRESRRVLTINANALTVKHFNMILSNAQLRCNVINAWFAIIAKMKTDMNVLLLDTSFISTYVEQKKNKPLGCGLELLEDQHQRALLKFAIMDIVMFPLQFGLSWGLAIVHVHNKTIVLLDPDEAGDLLFYRNAVYMLLSKQIENFDIDSWVSSELKTTSEATSGLQV